MIIFPASTVTYSNVFQLYANLTYVVSVSNRAYVPSRKYVTHLSFRQTNPKGFDTDLHGFAIKLGKIKSAEENYYLPEL